MEGAKTRKILTRNSAKKSEEAAAAAAAASATNNQPTKRKRTKAIEGEPRAKRCQIVLKRVSLTDYLLPNSLSSSQPSTSVSKPSSSAKQSSLSQPSSPNNSNDKSNVDTSKQPSLSQPLSSSDSSDKLEAQSSNYSIDSTKDNEAFDVANETENEEEEGAVGGQADHLIDSETEDEAFEVVVEGESEEENVAAVENPKKKKKTKADYAMEKTCKTFAEAEADVKDRKYGRTETKKVKNGWSHFFRCTVAKRRGKTKCQHMMKIFESDVKAEAVIFSSLTPHDHESIAEEDRSKKMSPEMRNFIVSQRKKNMSAKNIIKSINELKATGSMFSGEKTPNDKQVYYVAESQASKETPQVISVGDLVEWCEKNSTIPMDEDAPYVMGFEHSNVNESRFFRFMFSTQRLLKNCIGATTLVVDATYKLNWNGYPFLIVGTVDRARKFHALAYACTTNEKTEDYTFFFQTLIDAVKQIYNVQLAPKTLIADGAISIRNACELTFPTISVMVMCYVHVLRNVNKRALANSKKNRKPIMDDIEILHLAATEEKFDELSALFIKKWQKEELDFTRYFEQQWLGDLKYWFVGASAFDPSDNNHIEGYNSHVKRDITHRERMPLGQFTQKVFEMANELSIQYKENKKAMKDEPIMPTPLWKKGAIWASDDQIPTIKMSENSAEWVFYAPSTKWLESEKPFDLPSVQKIQQMTWKTFDQYVEFGHCKFYTVRVAKNREKWNVESQCDCPDFFRHYICKHIIGIALRRKIAVLPKNAIPTVLTQNKTSGRPAKAAKALLIQ